MAYEGALAIVNADGAANPAERAFLDERRAALQLSNADVADATRTAGALADAPVADVHSGTPPLGSVDEFILQQSILTGALEILPDRLANIAILPLQLLLVYQIGQRRGQKLDVNQVKDLAAIGKHFPRAHLLIIEPTASPRFAKNYSAPELSLVLRLAGATPWPPERWHDLFHQAKLNLLHETALTTDGLTLFLCRAR